MNDHTTCRDAQQGVPLPVVEGGSFTLVVVTTVLLAVEVVVVEGGVWGFTEEEAGVIFGVVVVILPGAGVEEAVDGLGVGL